jgi:hypothetical protein
VKRFPSLYNPPATSTLKDNETTLFSLNMNQYYPLLRETVPTADGPSQEGISEHFYSFLLL